MPNPSQTPAPGKCHPNHHMSLQEYAIYDLYRAFAVSDQNKSTGTVSISGAKLAAHFRDVSRQTVNDLTKALAEAGWLEVVRGKTMVATDKSRPIEYRPVNHAEWVLKHPDGCSKLNSDRQAGQPRRKKQKDATPEVDQDSDRQSGQADRQAGIVDQNTGMVDRQAGQSDRYTGQSDRQAGHINLVEPSIKHISKPTLEPSVNLTAETSIDHEERFEDLRDLDSDVSRQVPATKFSLEQIEPMKDLTQNQSTLPPKSPGGGAAVAAAPARPAQTFIPHSPFDCVDFSGESDLEFDESRLSGLVDHPAIHLPKSIKTNEDLLNQAGWEL